MARKHRFESHALEYLFERYVGNDPERVAAYEEALTNARVARAIYDLRSKAGLTQSALAKLIGTTPSVISRVEDASYQGHSLALLQRIAAALDHRIEVRFVPVARTVARERAASPGASKRIAAKRKTRSARAS